MFAKLAVTFVIIVQMTNGNPLENQHVPYDVKNFLSSRIVGGVDAPNGHARHMVALLSGYHVRFLVCGGSIITKRHVLSAAHCIEPFVIWGELSTSFMGVIGSKYWNSTRNEITFSGYKNHPEWDWNTIKNDIGVLCTEKDMVFDEDVAPIPLNFDWMGGGQHCYVTGWGRVGMWYDIPYHLQLLYVFTLTPEECFGGMQDAWQQWGNGPPVDPALEICTFHSVGHGMCNGDSGSALVLKDEREQIGIVSWGFPCALGAPDVFTRVGGFKHFIQDTVRNLV